MLSITWTAQSNSNSCWACCTRLVRQYYAASKPLLVTYASDKQLASAVALSATSMQNVQVALESLNHYSGQDDSANLPKFDEIKGTIDNGEPLVVCVTPKKISYKDNIKKSDNGHYVLIVGYDDTIGQQIYVMDPDPSGSKIEDQTYDSEKYTCGPSGSRYWAVTYYTEKG